MNHKPWQMGILGLGLVLYQAGCGNEQTTLLASTNAPANKVDRLKERARNAVTTSKDYFAQQKDRLQKSYSDKLSKADQQLADLKAKAAQAGQKTRSQWNKALSEFEQKRESAARTLEKLKEAGTDKWQELKTNAETAFVDLEKSFKETFARFPNDDKSAKP